MIRFYLVLVDLRRYAASSWESDSTAGLGELDSPVQLGSD